MRAALLRGIVRQLTGTQGRVEAFGVVAAAATGAREVRYSLPGLRMQRRALLSDVEYACVAYLAGRAGVASLSADAEDRARIDAALRRLAAGLQLQSIEGRDRQNRLRCAGSVAGSRHAASSWRGSLTWGPTA